MTSTPPAAGSLWQKLLAHPWARLSAMALFVPILYLTQAQEDLLLPLICVGVTFPIFATAFLAVLGRPQYIRVCLAVFGAAYILSLAVVLWPNPMPVESMSVLAYLPALAMVAVPIALLVWAAKSIWPDTEDTLPRYLLAALVISMLIVPVAAVMSQFYCLNHVDYLNSIPSAQFPATPEGEAARNKLISTESGLLIYKSCESIIIRTGTVYIACSIVFGVFLLLRLRSKPSLLVGKGVFPNTSDLTAILLAVIGMVSFYASYAILTPLKNQLNEAVKVLAEKGSTFHFSSSFGGVIGGIEAIPYVCLILGLAALTYRVCTAEKLRTKFSAYLIAVLIAIISIAAGGDSFRYPPAIPIALMIIIMLIVFLIHKKRWTEGSFSNPAQLASNAAIQGGIFLTYFASALFAISLALAITSSAHIHFFREWGLSFTAGKSLPVEIIQMEYDRSSKDAFSIYALSSLTPLLLYVSAVALAVLILSLMYWLPIRLYAYLRDLQKKMDAEEPASQP